MSVFGRNHLQVWKRTYDLTVSKLQFFTVQPLKT